jgi:hypothetical protein
LSNSIKQVSSYVQKNFATTNHETEMCSTVFGHGECRTVQCMVSCDTPTRSLNCCMAAGVAVCGMNFFFYEIKMFDSIRMHEVQVIVLVCFIDRIV